MAVSPKIYIGKGLPAISYFAADGRHRELKDPSDFEREQFKLIDSGTPFAVSFDRNHIWLIGGEAAVRWKAARHDSKISELAESWPPADIKPGFMAENRAFLERLFSQLLEEAYQNLADSAPASQVHEALPGLVSEYQNRLRTVLPEAHRECVCAVLRSCVDKARAERKGEQI